MRLKLFLFLVLALLFARPAGADAAPLGRPMWWKVSDGSGAVVWILGIPDGVLNTIEWNQDALDHRLDLADAAIMPLLQGDSVKATCGPPPAPARQISEEIPGRGSYSTRDSPQMVGGGPSATMTRPDAIRTSPPGDAAECRPVAWIINMVVPPNGAIYFDDPLARRLPPELLARVRRNLPPLLGDTGSAASHARTMDLALWLDLWNWPRGGLFNDPRLGNMVNRTAFVSARTHGLKLTIVPQPKLWMPVYASVYAGEVTPPEALQQKCLIQVLDQTESGQMPARRMAALKAWAEGDLEHALRRTGTVHYCLMGDEKSTSAQDYLRNAAYRYYSRLDRAFDKPGQTVALVELDPLLLEDGGVLDHFRKLGYVITTSDGMD